MKRLLSLRPLLLLCLVMAYTAAAAQNWKLKTETDGMKVYYRSTDAGHEIKLVTNLSTRLSALAALFNNVPDYPRWGYKVQNSRLLQRVSPTEFYFYQEFDFPWPLTDRDAVMHTRIIQDPTTRVITLYSNAQPDYLAESPNLVRVKKAQVRWTFTPAGNNLVHAEYWLRSDPGGLLPDWTVSMAADTGPVQTVQNIRKLLTEDQYRNAQLPYIRD
ncbi:MAG: hypothetical protein IT259_18855 [Saprospiraceae bacterium]|nr:hypothetical protein [Saprospiraceae bacterium]